MAPRPLRFQPGPIFANLVLADEINRATPKTQSALLEAMQERTVTSGTTTHELELPFLVMATQNPIEMEGTYPLPEAQLDRFLMKILVTYPSRAELNRIVERTIQREENDARPVMDRDAILEVRAVCREVLVAPHVQEYAIELVMATQPGRTSATRSRKKYIRYGSSPRGAQALVECGRVLALMRGRLHLSVEDVREIAPAVLRHRIILNFDAHADGQTPETILSTIIEGVTAQLPSRKIADEPSSPADRPRVSRKARAAGHPLAEIVSRLGRRPQHLALRRLRPGVSRSSQFPSRRRSARRQLARLHAPGKAVSQDVPGGAARAGAHAGGFQRLHDHRRPLKFDYARKLAAALCYVGLVRLDSICIQPFCQRPAAIVSVRRRTPPLHPAVKFLEQLKPGGRTNYFQVAREFISTYPQRGLVIIISDFLDDAGCERALQYLADFGHELMLVQIWADEDREPRWDGELELRTPKRGETLEIDFDDAARAQLYPSLRRPRP